MLDPTAALSSAFVSSTRPAAKGFGLPGLRVLGVQAYRDFGNVESWFRGFRAFRSLGFWVTSLEACSGFQGVRDFGYWVGGLMTCLRELGDFGAGIGSGLNIWSLNVASETSKLR